MEIKILEDLDGVICGNCIYGSPGEDDDDYVACQRNPVTMIDQTEFASGASCGDGKWMVLLEDDNNMSPYALSYAEAIETLVQRALQEEKGCCGGAEGGCCCNNSKEVSATE